MKHMCVSVVLVWFAIIAGMTAPGMAADIQGKVTAQGMKSAEAIVVYIDAIPGKTFTLPSQHATVDQKKMTFIPHVLPIVKGTTVDFLNSDSVGHNVYWPSISGDKKLSHNLGTWPQGMKRSFTFDNLGVASLLCNVHPEMSAYVVVVPTSYYAITDKDGNYAIKDVPPGNYIVKTWSEQGKPVSQPVQVTGASTTVNLSIHR